jgi:hypothetical protein
VSAERAWLAECARAAQAARALEAWCGCAHAHKEPTTSRHAPSCHAANAPSCHAVKQPGAVSSAFRPKHSAQRESAMRVLSPALGWVLPLSFPTGRLCIITSSHGQHLPMPFYPNPNHHCHLLCLPALSLGERARKKRFLVQSPPCLCIGSSARSLHTPTSNYRARVEQSKGTCKGHQSCWWHRVGLPRPPFTSN